MEQTKYLTVGALTKYLHRKFSADPYLERVYLTGEISNFRLRPRHQYFCLKDEQAKIDVVMYQTNFRKLQFEPQEGMKVFVAGRVDLYEANGVYQIIIDQMQPDGVGALYQAYEQLKEKLAKEGLFSAPKKPLIRYPKKIAVITSPSGAVIRDIITTLKRRYPIAQIVLFPAVVQGTQAADSLVGRLKEVNLDGSFDTIIIGRGGGSIEDLWPFNEESVARAIFASQIPVISSVGHETDTTIADLVADVRAATPTAAAELAAPVLDEEIIKLINFRQRLFRALQSKIQLQLKQLEKINSSYVFRQPSRLYEGYVQRLDLLDNRKNQAFKDYLQQNDSQLVNLLNRLLIQNPKGLMQQKQLNLNNLNARLTQAIKVKVQKEQQELVKLAGALDALSPLKVMGRGFSYVTAKEQVIKSVNQLSRTQEITLHLSDGAAKAEITEIIQGED